MSTVSDAEGLLSLPQENWRRCPFHTSLGILCSPGFSWKVVSASPTVLLRQRQDIHSRSSRGCLETQTQMVADKFPGATVAAGLGTPFENHHSSQLILSVTGRT